MKPVMENQLKAVSVDDFQHAYKEQEQRLSLVCGVTS